MSTQNKSSMLEELLYSHDSEYVLEKLVQLSPENKILELYRKLTRENERSYNRDRQN